MFLCDVALTEYDAATAVEAVTSTRSRVSPDPNCDVFASVAATAIATSNGCVCYYFLVLFAIVTDVD